MIQQGSSSGGRSAPISSMMSQNHGSTTTGKPRSRKVQTISISSVSRAGRRRRLCRRELREEGMIGIPAGQDQRVEQGSEGRNGLAVEQDHRRAVDLVLLGPGDVLAQLLGGLGSVDAALQIHAGA